MQGRIRNIFPIIPVMIAHKTPMSDQKHKFLPCERSHGEQAGHFGVHPIVFHSTKHMRVWTNITGCQACDPSEDPLIAHKSLMSDHNRNNWENVPYPCLAHGTYIQ